jgi:hypothetical protein
MNKKQKIVASISGIIIAVLLFTWLLHGGEIFTKTQVLIEKEDMLFGTTYNEWQDKFILGLDYTLAAIGGIILVSGILIFTFKNKKEKG